MITTNDDDVAKNSRILRDQGKESFNSGAIVKLGYNWRMTEISAAIGLIQLKRLPEMVQKRNKIAEFYDKKFGEMNGIRPLRKYPHIVNNYYKYTAILSPGINRDKFKRRLSEKGVICGGEVYWPPLHLQPVYKGLLGTKEGNFPNAEDKCRRMVCLPMFTQMTEDEAEYVTEQVSQVLQSLEVK
jgi:dTDP-4-amino-4,6-dideoxygalactose transaminase